jgi:hypothetical protein
MRSVLILLGSLCLILLLTGVPTSTVAASSDALASIQRKLQHIESNGKLTHPDQSPTAFTEQEINAYLSSGAVKFPSGVRTVDFQEQPGIVIANSQIDFDQLKAGINSSNPLLSMFSGVHDVIVNANAHGSGGKGFVHVNSASLDGVQVPRFVLQLFADKYLSPKYPQVGLDSEFDLPARIDTAVIGSHNLTITQK